MFGLFRKPSPITRVEPRIVAPEPEPARTVVRYAAAASKARFADWNIGGRSADAELQIALSVLRNRSRNLYRDNPHARRYFKLREDNIVGSTGFGFASQAKNAGGELDKTGNAKVAAAWAKWCKRVTPDGSTFDDVLRLVDVARARDGDVFIEILYGARHPDRIALHVHESDMVDETINRPAADGRNMIRMGVEIDDMGTPVAYHFLTYHRGDTDWTVQRRSSRRVPADRIIHLYQRTRPGQTRGEPDLCAVMVYLRMLDGYREAEVTGRRVRSSVGGFFEREVPESYLREMADTISDDGTLEVSLEPGQFRELPPGMTFKEFDPATGGEDFAAFEKAILRAIASGLGVSYNSLANDLEGVSYSSIRQGVLDDRERWMTEQAFLINHVVSRVYAQWLHAWMTWGEQSLPLSRYEKFVEGALFTGRRWGWVDPSKDVEATISELDAGLTSYSAIARETGHDYSAIVAELAADQALQKSAGVELGRLRNGQADEGAGSDDGKSSDDGGGNSKPRKRRE